MESKLELTVKTIYDASTTVWEDNGNILADAVRDSVVYNLSKITDESVEKIKKKIEDLVENAQ